MQLHDTFCVSQRKIDLIACAFNIGPNFFKFSSKINNYTCRILKSCEIDNKYKIL